MSKYVKFPYCTDGLEISTILIIVHVFDKCFNTHVVLADCFGFTKYGIQNPPEPSDVVFGEKSFAITFTLAPGILSWIQTADDKPMIPAPMTQTVG